MSEGSPKQEKRQILPQDYYDSRQVMALLKLSKQKYYELVEREEDPLPMRMYGWSTRGALAASSWHGSSGIRAWHAIARDAERTNFLF